MCWPNVSFAYPRISLVYNDSFSWGSLYIAVVIVVAAIAIGKVKRVTLVSSTTYA